MVTVKYTLFRSDGSEERGEATFKSATPGYHELKAVIAPLLDGAGIEHVSVLHGNRRADMFVDESGADRLPRNGAATEIYRNYTMTQEPGRHPEELPAIYGPAVLFDKIVWS